MSTSITKLLFRQKSTYEYDVCIEDVPEDTYVEWAIFMVKENISDLDADALITKRIGLGASADGIITDSGENDNEANLTFSISTSDIDTLTVGQLYITSVKAILDNGNPYSPPGLIRPVRVLDPIIEATS